MRQRGVGLFLKRTLDLGASLIALVLLSPLLATIAMVSRVVLGSPVLFRQMRPGKDGALFEAWKFRTMTDATDAAGRLLPDADRLTRYGRFLRAASLDELPQLVNVIRGDLSLVGPRPLLVHYLERYSPEQARRHEVLPGITGWAQIHGRNAISWADKFALDVWYVDHWSPWLDLKILATTLLKVIRREGISSEDCATMPEFMGDEVKGR